MYIKDYEEVTEEITTISYVPGTDEQKQDVNDTFGYNSGQKYKYGSVPGGTGSELDFSKVNSNDDWKKFDGIGFSYVCNLGCDQEFA